MYLELTQFGAVPRNGVGSGWFLEPRIVVTDAHVVPEEATYNFSGNEYFEYTWTGLKVLYRDELRDIAILEIPEEIWENFEKVEQPNYLKLADGNIVEGQEVYGIGNRAGAYFHFYRGVVSKDFDSAVPNVFDTFVDLDFFQGDSGGPVMNSEGDVIGNARILVPFNNDAFSGITARDNLAKAIFEWRNGESEGWNFDHRKIRWGMDIDLAKWVVKDIDGSEVAADLGLTNGSYDVVVYKNLTHSRYPIKSNDDWDYILHTTAKGEELVIEWTDSNGDYHVKDIVFSDVTRVNSDEKSARTIQ